MWLRRNHKCKILKKHLTTHYFWANTYLHSSVAVKIPQVWTPYRWAMQELLQYGLTSFWIFCNSCTIENIKNWSYYHLNIFKKYEFSQNLEDVAQKLSLPRPFLFWACQGRGSSNFLARSSKFWPSMDLLWTNKWCFYS